jgi:predicted dehydrogenase
MKKINWGIIGCGDVTEVKSGPAFNKVPNSSLIAVMRRNADKARDYAQRHKVPKWYDDADKLISDPDINAIYVATPPSSHEQYTLAAIEAGKHVYVEKPMSVNFSSAIRMANAAKEKNIKLVAAHYRRGWPLFKKVKQLITERAVGDVRFARLELYKKPYTKEELEAPKTSWRVDRTIAGGGLFNDLAPHQLDLMYYFFGEVEKATGYATNQARLYNADDIVAGNILFTNGIMFSGTWCFSVAEHLEKDYCEVFGTKGKIGFSFFDNPKIVITKKNGTETFSFDALEHVQQPMIHEIVKYFLDEGPNPCSGDDGAKIMRLIDQFTGI